MESKQHLLFYCQHLFGIGHLTRSLSIAKACLDEGWWVDFVQGGPDIGRTLNHQRFRRILLAPLLMREEGSELYDPFRQRSVAEIFTERTLHLETHLRETRYTCVASELFPFGRGRFKDEILRMLTLVRKKNPRAVRVCSVRDILVGKKNAVNWENKVVRLVHEHFDQVLVHSDEQVVRFDETFASAAKIASLLHYTGFVTEQGRRVEPTLKRRAEILVSFGGGVAGDELALAVLEAAERCPQYLFRLVTGPHSTNIFKTALNNCRLTNVRREDFLADFENQLSRVELSISLAGYNTLMNILSTATPALVLPYDGDHEQAWRAHRLQDLGQLKVLRRSDLVPDRLCELIHERLRSPSRSMNFALNGGHQSALRLAELVAGS